ncbi:hypothetical protein RchiOBHm_Chr5g0064781 [Rosa chinensis]|uniref:Uncharacterized protein n=1 Tax=Rosa chinensis TaxID=74649 RepID=A0A2P6QIQ9_ROSCH|nr:hypothetical protein RchiOBHm_Chr5g0064781 [Rosa chinensis]
MHIEKNICESIIGTMLHSGKSKDGISARKDLEDMGIRKDLHPQQHGSRLYLPPAPHTFSRSEKKDFARGYMILKGLMVIAQILGTAYHWRILRLWASNLMIIMF